MEPRRDLGVLPIPEHRKRRVPVLMVIGVIALIAGWLLDFGFVWGIGLGILIVGGVAMLADRSARRRAPN